jgi:endonuclease/exonuclease/phosphatase family metal-dependent hydrolase
VQGRGHKRVVLPFHKILPELVKTNADVICLQEMPDAKDKFRNSPKLGAYQKFIPKLNNTEDKNKPGFNHNVLLSRHPILSAEEIIFPKFSEKSAVLESAIKADIKVGEKIVRLYTCHLNITQTGIIARLRQLDTILKDAVNWDGPIIICGDMNTAMPKNQIIRRIFKWWHKWPNEEIGVSKEHKNLAEKEILHNRFKEHGFKELLDLNQPTWAPFPLRSSGIELFKLKLDWFLVKNLHAAEATLGRYISDHRPVNVVCRLLE